MGSHSHCIYVHFFYIDGDFRNSLSTIYMIENTLLFANLAYLLYRLDYPDFIIKKQC
jgi:hypothetical protein